MTCFSSTGPVDPPASSHGLPSQTELPNTAFLVVQKRSHTILTFGDDGSIVFSFLADYSTFSNPSVVALGEGLLFLKDRTRYEELEQVKAAESMMAQIFQAMNELVEMVSENISLKEEIDGLKESSGTQISSLEDHLENCQLEVEIAT
ncbi:Uncharacterized protein Adt_05220 [Abeliophyllum distichum]|uniref:Uncharacterized protein n=1 Tax=Abeliophyllum distichum TaxID=126358 RepID=A0ABD1V3G8_9LAMI